ncbi:MAG: CTP--2,3-di-O-geranylgeranyl-sn-glycero-1-phosphate cytidyltransferase [Nanoarchaeota archaeon]|nr:CTP--2,3-di-O-geranylgeranyl-sn-glycero-1-phosphate cytidyltransferase [Nanoarchaeota archaeon]
MDLNILRELKRRAFYIGLLLLVVLYYVLERSVSKSIALFTLVFVFVFFLAIEYIRIELNIEISGLRHLISTREERRMHGATYFIAATIISLAVFDFRIALAALLMSVLGDMAASIVGQFFGRTPLFRDKTLTGFLSELVVTLIVGFIVLNNIYIILAMAFTATIVEAFVNELDDNLFVPLFAGFVGQLIFLLI